jgi:transcription termination factor Rho
MQEMKLQELKNKTPTDLLAFAESVEVENAGVMRKQELMFAILKQLAAHEVEIIGDGVVEILQDGFGFLRSASANYLPGPDDIYISPSQIRRFSLKTGDTVQGPIRGPKEGERYFALFKVNTINFEDPEKIRHKSHFDNLTPLYPDERFKMEIDNPTSKDSRRASSIWWRRSARASADSSSRRRAPVRRCCCRTSPIRSRPTIRNAT